MAILFALPTPTRDVFRRLMDAVDPALVDTAEHALLETPGVQGVRRLRIRWLGHILQAEADLEVDPTSPSPSRTTSLITQRPTCWRRSDG